MILNLCLYGLAAFWTVLWGYTKYRLVKQEDKNEELRKSISNLFKENEKLQQQLKTKNNDRFTI